MGGVLAEPGQARLGGEALRVLGEILGRRGAEVLDAGDAGDSGVGVGGEVAGEFGDGEFEPGGFTAELVR